VTRKCSLIFQIFSCYFHENKFVHVATKKQTYSYHPIFPPAQQLKNFLAGCLESEPGWNFILYSQFTSGYLWDTFPSFPYNFPRILFTIFIISLQELIVIYTMVKNKWKKSAPEFVNLLRSPGIDSQPSGIDSWALTFSSLFISSVTSGGKWFIINKILVYLLITHFISAHICW
jgi:hypothetical protein